MSTQRVEGHTPLGIRIAEWCADNAAIAANPKTPLGAQLEIAYKLMREQSNNIERLEKMNEALVRACEELVNWAEHNAMWDKCGQSYYKAKAALSLAKEPA